MNLRLVVEELPLPVVDPTVRTGDDSVTVFDDRCAHLIYSAGHCLASAQLLAAATHLGSRKL